MSLFAFAQASSPCYLSRVYSANEHVAASGGKGFYPLSYLLSKLFDSFIYMNHIPYPADAPQQCCSATLAEGN